MGLTKRPADDVQDPFAFPEHVIGRKPQHPVSLGPEPVVPADVRWFTTIVTGTVDLHDETGAQAREVGHIGPDRRLAAESVAVQVSAAQVEPEPGFDAGHVSPEAACPKNVPSVGHWGSLARASLGVEGAG